MSVFLGYNAGGTKTDCVLLDGGGRILAESSGGPANPLRIGFAKACASLGDTAQRALAEAHKRAEEVRAICAGIGGAGRPRVARRLKSYLTRAFPQSTIRVTTDIDIALEAAVGQEQGIVIIAGTGSAAAGRNSAGKIVRVGGWGPWIGDDGSSYEIGRHAVESALRARDHLGPTTVLGEKILLAEEARDWDVLTERLAKHPDRVLPKLYPVVIEAADVGDKIAAEILTTAAKSLAFLASSVIDQLELKGQVFPLAKSGGVMGRSRILDSVLDQELLRIAPNAKIEPLQTSPARVAAELARKSVGNAAAHRA
jgi:N-acetylmuramic acid 6-phosphate etherase